MAAAGFTGATYPVIIAHARSFFPAHLAGRGVTLINLFGMGGIGLMQAMSGRLHSATVDPTALPGSYQVIFLFFGFSLLIGVAIYLFSRDSLD